MIHDTTVHIFTDHIIVDIAIPSGRVPREATHWDKMEGREEETNQYWEEAAIGRGLIETTGQSPQRERGTDWPPDRNRCQEPQGYNLTIH